MIDKIENGWDIYAAEYMQEMGTSLDEAREHVIIDWLLGFGDTRPYSDWVFHGYKPSRKVSLLLAEMMNPRSPLADSLKFVLLRKKYGKNATSGPIPNPENSLRDWLLARSVKRRIEVGSKYETAIADEVEAIKKEGGRLSPNAVRKAYDEVYGGKSR